MSVFPLRFIDHNVETLYIQEKNREDLVRLRIAIILGMITLGSFSIIDVLFFPWEEAKWLIFSRLIVGWAGFLATLFYTHTKNADRYVAGVSFGIIIWIGLTILSNFFVSTNQIAQHYYVGLIVTLLFGYVFIRLRSRYTILTGTIISFGYLAVGFIMNFHTGVFATSCLFLFIINFVGITANYLLEFSSRREFWTQRQLEIEQKKLQEANLALDKLLDLRTNELQLSKAFMNNLTTGVATDLNAPIQSARGYLELLIERNKPNFDSTSWDFIRLIKKQSDKMMAMQDALVEYSRLQEENTRFSILDANLLVQTAMQGLTQDIQKTGAQITVLPLPSIIGDEVQLIMLFRKLLSNALRFNDQNPPKIEIKAQFLPNDHTWQFSIRDNGSGIALENHRDIFEFFTQINPEEGRSGTGMGLAICKRIIELHDGQIWVESEPGKGSTFYFTLKESIQKE